MLRRARALLTLGVARGYRRAGLVGELDVERAVDALDGADRVLDELEVVDVAELLGIMLGPFGIEQLEAA